MGGWPKELHVRPLASPPLQTCLTCQCMNQCNFTLDILKPGISNHFYCSPEASRSCYSRHCTYTLSLVAYTLHLLAVPGCHYSQLLKLNLLREKFTNGSLAWLNSTDQHLYMYVKVQLTDLQVQPHSNSIRCHKHRALI